MGQDRDRPKTEKWRTETSLIVACVMTVILFGISASMFVFVIYMSSTYWFGDYSYNEIFLVIPVLLCHLARLVFQIKVIRWISGKGGPCGDYAKKNGYSPLLPQTMNGYQSI